MTRRLMMKLKWNWEWLKVLNSPFKSFKLKFYFGEIAVGLPYFFPRKLVPNTKEYLIEKWHSIPKEDRESKNFDDYYKKYIRYQHAVPKKWSIDLVPLGWKTKYEYIRHEWSPLISFVGFNKQFVIFITLNADKEKMADMCYWEAWLYYNYRTDRKKSKTERLKEVFEQYSCTWGSKNEYTDYYPLILKKKYHKYIPKTKYNTPE